MKKRGSSLFKGKDSLWNVFLNVYKHCKDVVSIKLLTLSIFLTLISSAMEAFSLGLIVPLLEIALKHSSDITSFAFLKPLYDLLGISNNITMLVIFTAILIILAVIIKNLFAYLSTLITLKIGTDVTHKLRTKTLEQLLKYDLLFFEKNTTGDLNYTIGLSSSFSELIGFMQGLVMNLMIVLSYIVLLIYLSWRMSLFIFILIPILYLSVIWLRKVIDKLSREQVVINSKLATKTFEILSSVLLIKSYSTEKKEKSDFEAISNNNRKLAFKLGSRVQLISKIQEPLIFGIAMIVAALSYVYFLDGIKGAIAGFMTFFVILKRFEYVIQNLITQLTSIIRYKAPLEKINSFFKRSKWMTISTGKKQFKGIKNNISFENVYSKYNDENIIKGVNLKIKKGTTIGIVGESGSGKSSLISLIPRIFEYNKGNIKIDGNSIRDFDIKSLRKQISIVTQDVVILNKSIRDNILYGIDRVITDKELNEIAKEVEIYDYIITLKNKFNTIVGERGVELSRGQRQRIALARAIVKNSSLIILDEATSALDNQTEEDIENTFKKVLKGRTVIKIAHRLSTIRNADYIVVLENGKISEKGTFNQLLRKKKIFYHYWKLHIN